MSAVQTPPRWDMTPIFPSLNAPEFATAFSSAIQNIAQLEALFDECDVRRLDRTPPIPEVAPRLERVLDAYNRALDDARTVSAYIQAFVTTDSRDQLARARESEFQQQTLPLAQLGARFTAWVGSLDVEALIAASPVAADHAFALRKASQRALHQMAPVEEALAIELNLTGGSAWARLHGVITSQLTVQVEIEGATKRLPMSMARNLASSPDREVRRSAYEAELAGWRSVATPLAAALNSIKGEVDVLTRRRGWKSPLDAALFDANIDQQTFDAMMSAANESFPDFRRYLRAKARALELERLAWYDLFAPIEGSGRSWSFDQSASFIVEQFGAYSPRLSEFAARAFRERWIDAEPREGKRDGAYCMSVRGEESRVFANYKSVFDGLSTLAHELGHGYHNLNLANRTMLQRATPMTLAETASIFCETIIRNAAIATANRADKIEILEASLQGSCQVVVDITSRFLFERKVFEQRRQRELSNEELCALMLEAQGETYGDGLDESALHPYMWAMKPHYYSTGRSFYNFPYLFGLLFGLGLYARYQRDPVEFRARYDTLLSSTGLADAATLASGFGIDIQSVDFWRQSLDVVREDVSQFEQAISLSA